MKNIYSIYNQDLINCNEKCYIKNFNKFKINLLDFLFNRTVDEKVYSFCHLHCLKCLKIGNVKRNGRYAFKKLLGFTEFFSSLFSLLSLFTSIYYYKKYLKNIINKHPLSFIIRFHFYASSICMLFSCLFHLHENSFTKYGDYFGAISVIYLNLMTSILRNILILKPNFIKYKNYVIFAFFFFYAIHVHKLTVNFDYSFNKRICIAFVILTNISLFKTCQYYFYKEREISINILKYQINLIIAGLFEIIDKPPVYFFIDSHSMWHIFLFNSVPFLIKYTSQDINFFLNKKN